MTYTPPNAGEHLLADGDGWQLLAESLQGGQFPDLSSLRMSISAFLVPQEGNVDVTREMCEEVEKRLAQEVAGRFEGQGRGLSLSITVQSLREVFPITDE